LITVPSDLIMPLPVLLVKTADVVVVEVEEVVPAVVVEDSVTAVDVEVAEVV